MPEKLPAHEVVAAKEAPRERFHAACVPFRDAVPCLGMPEVDVVDAVEIHVFRVPAEGCLPHAKVQVRGVDSLDAGAQLLVQEVQASAWSRGGESERPLLLLRTGRGIEILSTLAERSAPGPLPGALARGSGSKRPHQAC